MATSSTNEIENELALANSLLEKIAKNPKLIAVEDFEIAIQFCRRSSLTFQAREATRYLQDRDCWISVRLLNLHRLGCATTSQVDDQALASLVEHAFFSLHSSSSNPWSRFPLWKSIKEIPFPELPYPDQPFESLVGSLADSQVERGCHTLQQTVTVVARKTEKNIRRAVCRNFRSQFEIFWNRSWLRKEFAGDNGFASQALVLSDFKEYLSQEPHAKAWTPTEKALPVLLSPDVGKALLFKIGNWFCEDRISFGESPYAPGSDEALFSPVLKIQDNGLAYSSSNYLPFDLEGTGAQATPLVSDTRLLRGLCDGRYGAKGNRPSTGSWRRGFGHRQARIAPSKLEILPGEGKIDPRQSGSGPILKINSIIQLDESAASHGLFRLDAAGEILNLGEITPVLIKDFSFELPLWLKQISQVGDDTSHDSHCASPSIFLENAPIRN